MKKPEAAVPSSTKIKFESDDDHDLSSNYSSSSDEEEVEIERELEDVTFEELQKAKCNGMHSVPQKRKSEKTTGRANKNRPREASCKKPVARFREVVQAPKKVVRDPRFESLSGNFDEEGFRKRFSFFYEDNLPAERLELKKQLAKTSDPEVISELKSHMSWIDNQLKTGSTKRTDTAILTQHKKKEREAAKHGKRPFYLKQSEIRKQRLVEKYKSLKETGKLESFIEKRRRKNASKDHRYIPYRRSTNEQQDN